MFFKNDPLITWKKVLCPLCSEPTGPKSICHQMQPAKEVPIYKRNISSLASPIMPVFSENCTFRQENLWSADINYPVSKPLIDKLKIVNGVNQIQPTKAYTFQVSISNLYDDTAVRLDINNEYINFIKELQRIELELIGDSNKIIGIQLPNNQKFLIQNNENKEEQIVNIKKLFDNVSGCQFIEG